MSLFLISKDYNILLTEASQEAYQCVPNVRGCVYPHRNAQAFKPPQCRQSQSCLFGHTYYSQYDMSTGSQPVCIQGTASTRMSHVSVNPLQSIRQLLDFRYRDACNTCACWCQTGSCCQNTISRQAEQKKIKAGYTLIKVF